MRRVLLALVAALAPTLAFAQPPQTGSTHTFVDPVFQGTIFCDTLEEVTAIATAPDATAVYTQLVSARNERDEPRCLAMIPTGVVVSTTHLGFMERAGRYFRAWAVETQVGEVTGYALYLEHIEMARA
jgi:hypothetical protein